MKKELLKQQNQQDNLESTLVEIEPVEGTPFSIVKEDNKIKIVMGQYIVADDILNKEDAYHMINNKSWKLIIGAACVVIETSKK